VAEETETVFFIFIFSIKFVRKGKAEDKGVVRTVGIMAGRAIPLHHGTMLIPPFLPGNTLLMARITESVYLIAQKVFDV
jgi:hypothetical protein